MLSASRRALRAAFCGWNAAAAAAEATSSRRVPPAVSRTYGTSQTHYNTTVDPEELKRFQALSQKWWDEKGEFAALHALNELRVPFIRDTLLTYCEKQQLGCPLDGFVILDVGCGGGLLCEPLGRLGAEVTGIDPLEENIKTATVHKSFDPILQEHIQYSACSLEELVTETTGKFDAVIASEVVEHVNDVETFIRCCAQVIKPEGSLFLTTINKTTLSYAIAIVVAEKVLRIVPSGTHEWQKFISPEELEKILKFNGFTVETVNGMLYNPLSASWSWITNTSVNYALHAVKCRVDNLEFKSEPERDQGQNEGTHHSESRSGSTV